MKELLEINNQLDAINMIIIAGIPLKTQIRSICLLKGKLNPGGLV